MNRILVASLKGKSQRQKGMWTGSLNNDISRRYSNNNHSHKNNDIVSDNKFKLLYEGPLGSTYRKLKGFSLASLGLASSMTPFFFLIDTSLPLNAKIILASTVLGTSGISTALVGWCGKPYVSRLWQSEDGATLEMETITLHLKRRFTTVYDWKTFLRESERPFAKWELVNEVEKKNVGDVQLPEEETVAETRDEKGRVIGRWIVQWKDGHIHNRKGICFGEGRITRFVI
ncbi:hypothetical protein Clacol_002825 [Clathrus columnatus]|uniref:Uncharacterized protein n=1 Tax=Clathrus columnatus TaxID=1419009 RepID=A0AAV5A6H4_9AGAM|nr:hypothetical protein Clacol_002825 [Clathrus columnatus]